MPGPPFGRRRLLALSGAAAVGGFSLRPSLFRSEQRLDASVPPKTWPMAGRDPGRTGHSPDGTGPTADPSVAWSFDTGDDAVVGLPVVASADAVYTRTRFELLAIDADDGRERWRFSRPEDSHFGEPTRQSFQTPPILVDGTVFAGADVSLHAVAASDGSGRWSYRTNSSFRPLLAVGNTVLLNSLVGDEDRTVALDAETGLVRWRTTGRVTGLASGAGLVLAAIDPRDGAAVVALDARSGEERWRRTPGNAATTHENPLAVAGGRVFYATDSVAALSLADGAVEWERPSAVTEADGSPVTDGETVYVTGSDAVVALDAATGRTRWRTTDHAARGTPALAGETLYCPTYGGVVARDTTDGRERFRFPMDGTPGSPVVANGRLYVGGEGTVYALEEP